MSLQINFLGQKSSRVYPKISKSLIPTNPVQICAVQQDQHLGIYVCVRAVHTYKSGDGVRDGGRLYLFSFGILSVYLGIFVMHYI